MKEPSATCPCGCNAVGKLSPRGHNRGCICRSCIGRRNRRNGQRGEMNAHRSLGGTGRTPADEVGHTYSLNVKPQVKAGQQIPAAFSSFIASEWFRHAISQAERSIPVGVDAKPAVQMLPSGGGIWMVVKL